MGILFSLDSFLFAFINGSGFTILTILGVLKILAKETKWSGDDKIIDMFINMVTRKKPKEK